MIPTANNKSLKRRIQKCSFKIVRSVFLTNLTAFRILLIYSHQKNLKDATKKAYLAIQSKHHHECYFGKKKVQFVESICLELSGATWIALEETDYGWITFRSSDELFERKFSISIGIHLTEYFFCSFFWR